MTRFTMSIIVLAAVCVRPAPAQGPDIHYTRLLRQPAISETLLADATRFQVTHDSKKLLVQSGDSWIIAAAGKIEPGMGRLATADIEVRIEPRAEWGQIFNEAWSINRDYFYDPNMHGADWPAV